MLLLSSMFGDAGRQGVGQTVQSFRQFHQDMIRKAPMMREEVIGLIKT